MIVAGFGFRTRATVDSFQGALAKCTTPPVTDFAVPVEKSQHTAFQAFAHATQTSVHLVRSDHLQLQKTPTQSAKSLALKGTGSVAEAAALAAAGPGARLTHRRVISDDGCVTCAIAIRGPK
ncbi:MAG: cobalamin biosynthesis protein [Pseudomonadota bacterium]